MKKVILYLIAAIATVPVFAQTEFVVTGKVIDSATSQPLAAASVFAENTTIGTVTESDGSFKLHLPNGGYNLVTTFTGYHTESKRITTADADNKNLVFTLRQKQKEMQDVVIKASYEVADGWTKYGNFFLDEFIGKTANSKQCQLLNNGALKFYFYKRKNRLKVLATEPLELKNDALGYVIRYNLDSFVHEYNTETSVYSGNPLFLEMTPSSDEQRLTWAANRLKAYQGSLLHFMRSLYNKELEKEGFEVQFLVKPLDKEMAIPVKDIYGGLNYDKDDSTRTVEIKPNQPEIALLYKREVPGPGYLEANPDEPAKFELSVFSFQPGQSIVIEQNGYYFEQTDFVIRQYLSWEKVADMLPYDFVVK